MPDYRQSSEAYYQQQAASCGLESSSTMPDEIVREREVQAIFDVLDRVMKPASPVLEIGCGNGLLLSKLRGRYAHAPLTGIDYTPAMVELARTRSLADTRVERGDVTRLDLASAAYDIVVSERVIINVLEREDQARAFAEVARVLRPGGHFVCIEGFAGPLRHLNEARAELCLPEIPMPAVNRWFEDDDFPAYLAGKFEILTDPSFPRPNFLSSHYFVTRVFHDAIRPAQGKLRNTHFARFFAEALPPVGDYAPVKLYVLRRL